MADQTPLDEALAARLDQAMRRLDELEARVRDQDAELRMLRATASPAPPATGSAVVRRTLAGPAPGADEPGPARTDRRHLLRSAGVAVAAAGGAAVLSQAAPAAAKDGDALVAGQTVTSQSPTTLRYDPLTPPSGALFRVADTDTIDIGDAAVVGLATTTVSDGVAGVTDIPGAAGVSARGRGTDTYGLRVGGARSAVRITPTSGDPRSRPDQHLFGELDVDVLRNLWYCDTSGGPGTWRRLAGPGTVGALSLLATPARVYDSRTGFLPNTGPKGKLTNDQELTVDVHLNGGVAPGSVAALINLTATNTGPSGWLSVFKGGIAWPGTSTLNWSMTGTNIANTCIVALNAATQITIRCAGTCDVAVDVIGAFY